MKDCESINYSSRLVSLRYSLTTLACEAILIENPQDIFYLTGLELSAGKLLISLREACLIVDGRYYERSCYQTLYQVQLLKENSLREWIVNCGLHQLGFDRYYTSYHAFLRLNQLSVDLQDQGYKLKIIPVESLVKQLRLIKDAHEIACLRQASHLGYQGYQLIVSLLREGITESELAFELEFFWKKRGASRFAFDPIIAFGRNSSLPHHRAGPTALSLHDPVLIDIGVVLAHYHSDMTRVIFFGNPQPVMRTIYKIVEEAKEHALALCRPGTLVGDLDRAARAWIDAKGYGDYFPHSLGHGLGIEIHEAPTIRMMGAEQHIPLQQGMVITIEPGIYVPGYGGVRLEDTILITENGYENLTVESMKLHETTSI